MQGLNVKHGSLSSNTVTTDQCTMLALPVAAPKAAKAKLPVTPCMSTVDILLNHTQAH